MAKEIIPSTPETRAKKLEDKKEVSKAFSKTFFAALAVCLSVLLIYSVCYISFFRPKEQTIEGGSSAPASSNTVINNGGSSSTNNGGSSSTDNGGSAAPADNGNSAAPADNGGSAAPADNGGSAAPADNSAQSVLDEFNTAINKVKGESSSITHVSGGTSSNGGLDDASKLNFALKAIAGTVIDAAMSSNGVKADGSVIPASDFPVKGQGYSSQLTDADIVSATKNGNTITIVLKDDELGETDSGHCQKAMNIVKSTDITSNIPDAVSSIISIDSAETSCKAATITATIDSNGHVTNVVYHYNWDLEIKSGSSIDAILHFAGEDTYEIAY